MKKVTDYYGVSKRTIMNYMNKFGLNAIMRLDLDVDKMIKLLQRGLHYIAQKFNVGYSTVREDWKRHRNG